MAFFYVNSFLAVFFTSLAITSTRSLHALLYFMASIISIALCIYYLGSPFLAGLLVIIYAGAIITLFVFVVMVLNLKRPVENAKPFVPILIFSIFVFEFLFLLKKENFGLVLESKISHYDLATILFTKYGILVEVASLLLLAALIAAFHLGAKHKKRV